MKLQDLKLKTPDQLLQLAEENGVENASTLLKQEMIFAILKKQAEKGEAITGEGVIEVLGDGFGFLRSPLANYLAGPDDIYVSPSQIRRFALRTGDTVAGEIRAPKDGERYFALLKVNTINYDDPDMVRHRINFDNLVPLYPERKIKLEVDLRRQARAKERSKKSRNPIHSPSEINEITAPTSQAASCIAVSSSKSSRPTTCPCGSPILWLLLVLGSVPLIVAPPRTGKTVLLQNIAHSISINHPGAFLIVLLIDERPGGSNRHAAHGERRSG